MNNELGKIYACFDGTGKTYLSRRFNNFIDLDIDDFMWIKEGIDINVFDVETDREKELNKFFPQNYILEIYRLIHTGQNVLISCNSQILWSLHDSGLPFIIVTPSKEMRPYFIDKYMNNERIGKDYSRTFYEDMKESFNEHVQELLDNSHCQYIIMITKPDIYLSDILVSTNTTK